ncbi:MAG: hypothetical protein RSE38_00735 [Acinetobacter sp.]
MIELKNAVNEAKIKLGLSNSELSKLIGHSRNYISETLRIGASTEKQAEIIGRIKEAVSVELVSRGVGMSCDDEQKHNVRMLNMEVELAKSDLAIANRDKNFMKKKLQDKNFLINWLVASNVFFILFLVAKCVGWV